MEDLPGQGNLEGEATYSGGPPSGSLSLKGELQQMLS